MTDKHYTIKQVSRMAGLTVRTLHHYDQIGLLSPDRDGENGYRFYDRADLLRLQQILFLRELDFPLEQIGNMLIQAETDRPLFYQEHRQLLEARQQRLVRLLKTLDQTIEAMKGTVSMNDEELLAEFSDQKQAEYEEEAEARWGQTEAWRQSRGKWESLTSEQKDQMKRDQLDLQKRLAEAKRSGQPVDSPDVQVLIAEHRHGINFFYDCSDQIYEGLANMYVVDPRFARNYDRFEPGLAEFVRQAMLASMKK